MVLFHKLSKSSRTWGALQVLDDFFITLKHKLFMDNEQQLSDAFLKQLKTGDQLKSLLGQLQKRGIEKILEGELDAHLGYGKYEKSTASNAHNGTFSKKVKPLLAE